MSSAPWATQEGAHLIMVSFSSILFTLVHLTVSLNVWTTRPCTPTPPPPVFLIPGLPDDKNDEGGNIHITHACQLFHLTVSLSISTTPQEKWENPAPFYTWRCPCVPLLLEATKKTKPLDQLPVSLYAGRRSRSGWNEGEKLVLMSRMQSKRRSQGECSFLNSYVFVVRPQVDRKFKSFC